MMAAAQPFISGAISKTINLPNEATVQEIKDCYRLSWDLGLKANALYRDGCKLSQPLSATSDEAKKEAGHEAAAHPPAAEAAPTEQSTRSPERADSALVSAAATGTGYEEGTHLAPPKAHRRRLADTRRSVTHKFNVAGHEGYLTVGLYDDGQPGELFITMSKEGSTIGGLMDSLGTATSVSLQYGVPIGSLVSKFSHQRFEPAGMTENRDIPIAKSLVDYIFRWMGMQFIEGYREQHAPNRRAEREEHAAWKSADRMNPGATLAPPSVPASPLPRMSPVVTSGSVTVVESKRTVVSTINTAVAELQTDAPACDVCGTITVRSGTCYKCVNCGNSMGCS